ncbi:hypothetical protein POM88_039541 [Heracleum sosnowskyi]|uniref:Uncharacterized protein n=1 Tax=Heracleum sosnowskyi TaxID=360622 RepID=A0AAD8HAJ8_9APIA|nr:hypothetical protein POM88_039541 [Heracleum sosnowskyi]
MGTKRRTLNDEQGKKSSASDQLFEANSIPFYVGRYRVKAANAHILTSILTKYGDTAAYCMFTSAAVRASMLKLRYVIVSSGFKATMKKILYSRWKPWKLKCVMQRQLNLKYPSCNSA